MYMYLSYVVYLFCTEGREIVIKKKRVSCVGGCVWGRNGLTLFFSEPFARPFAAATLDQIEDRLFDELGARFLQCLFQS